MKRLFLAVVLTLSLFLTTVTAFCAENDFVPFINGVEAETVEIIIRAHSNIYNVNGVEKVYPKELGTVYIDDYGNVMMPLSATSIMTGQEKINIEWNDSLKQAYIFYDDNKNADIKNGDIVFTADSDIVYVKNSASLMTAKAVLKDGHLYIPMKDIFKALNIQDKYISYDYNNNTITIKRKLNFDTNKITIMTTAQKGISRKYMNITDKNIIDKIVNKCMEGFYDSEKTYRYVCDYIVDFNNGTSIGIYSNEEKETGHINNGYDLYGGQKVPEGLFDIIKDIADRYIIYIDNIDITYKDTTITLIVKNNGLSDINYSEDYVIEMQQQDENKYEFWNRVDVLENGKKLFSKSGDKTVFVIKLDKKLEKGTYRIIKNVNNDENFIKFEIK